MRGTYAGAAIVARRCALRMTPAIAVAATSTCTIVVTINMVLFIRASGQRTVGGDHERTDASGEACEFHEGDIRVVVLYLAQETVYRRVERFDVIVNSYVTFDRKGPHLYEGAEGTSYNQIHRRSGWTPDASIQGRYIPGQ